MFFVYQVAYWIYQFDLFSTLGLIVLGLIIAYYARRGRARAVDMLEAQPDNVQDEFYRGLNKASLVERVHYQLSPSGYVRNFLNKMEVE